MRPWHELAEIRQAGGPEAIDDLARPWTEGLEPLTGIPEFRYQAESWSDALGRATALIAWLLALNGVLFWLAYAGFQRRDLRQAGQ